MPRKSKIASHPQRREMEKAFLSGQSVTSIAIQYKVDPQCLGRHLKSNRSGLSRQMAKSYELKSNAEGSEMLQLFVDRLEGLTTNLNEIIIESQGKDNPTTVSAIRELRNVIQSQFTMLAAGKQAGIVSVEDEQYQDEEKQKKLHNRLQKFTNEERHVFGDLVEKSWDMLPDNNRVIIPAKPVDKDGLQVAYDLKLAWVAFDSVNDNNKPETSDTILLKEKDNSLDAVKTPDKTEIQPDVKHIQPEQEETEQKPMIRTKPANGRSPRLARHLIGRKIVDRQQQGEAIGGSLLRPGGLPLPGGENDNAGNDDNPFGDREYAD